MAGLRIVVTGGCGFVGVAVISELKRAFPSCAISILDKSIKSIRPEVTFDLPIAHVDITSALDVQAAFAKERPDFVIHTAGFVPPLQERYSRDLESFVKDTNVTGTRHVVEAAIACGARGLIYTSSCCAVTDDLHGYFANIDERWPVSPRSLIYGESKVEAEQIVLSANRSAFSTCVLRPAVIFGEVSEQRYQSAPQEVPSDPCTG
jgi:sterol-4alpha-carboxylate 3-dehydrogenase (decarboxylating)